MSSAATSGSSRTLVQVGCVLVGLAVPLAVAVPVLVFGPSRHLTERGAIGSTLVVDLSADRDWAVYTTLSTWRAAGCAVTDADGDVIVLRPDMAQQTLRGTPTWYPQGSFRLDQDRRLSVRCDGPPGQFAVGRSVGFGHLLLSFGLGLVGVLAAAAGLILLIMAAVRRNRVPGAGTYPRDD
jgi:hypothetical protein